MYLFKAPSRSEVIQRELAEARLSLLESESALDWAQSMCDYNRCRIKRLEQKLNEISTNNTD